jgi:hypothetical protein
MLIPEGKISASDSSKIGHMEAKAVFQELEITAAQFAGPGIGFINPTETVISVLLHAILARYQSQYDFRLYLQNKIL